MGIKEFLGYKDQNLTKFWTEREQRKNYKIFDAEREINRKDWRGMESLLAKYQKDKNSWGIAWQAAEMKILSPNRMKNVTFEKKGQDMAWNGMQRRLEELRKDKSWYKYLWMVRNMTILYPDRMRNFNVKSMPWQDLRESLTNNVYWDKRMQGSNFATMVMSLSMLSPGIVNEINEDTSSWERMYRELGESRARKDWYLYSFQAMSMRVLSCEKTKDLKPDGKVWSVMRSELVENRIPQEYVNRGWGRFTTLAANMHILSLSEAELAKHGLLPPMLQLSQSTFSL